VLCDFNTLDGTLPSWEYTVDCHKPLFLTYMGNLAMAVLQPESMDIATFETGCEKQSPNGAGRWLSSRPRLPFCAYFSQASIQRV
jgi:hypothetical protein